MSKIFAKSLYLFACKNQTLNMNKGKQLNDKLKNLPHISTSFHQALYAMSKQTNIIIMLLNDFSMHSTYLNVIRGLSYLLPSICSYYPIEIIKTLKNLRKDFKFELLLHQNSF